MSGRIWMIALSAAIGMAATVMVAWACALWSPLPSGLTGSGAAATFPLRGHVASVPGFYAIPPVEYEFAFAFADQATGAGLNVLVFGARVVPQGIRCHIIDPEIEVRSYWAGWPWPALCGTLFVGGPATPGGAVLAPPWAKPSPAQIGFCSDLRALPYWPSWAGLIGDSALFTGAAWMLLGLPGVALRRLRVQRGLCPTCRYDLAGNTTGVCPECGATTARTTA